MNKRMLSVAILLATCSLSGCSRAAAPTVEKPSDTPLTATTSASMAANPSPTPAPTVTPDLPWLATPVAESPAAGICASFDEQVVRIQILPDIPDPRCVQVRGEQLLSIRNGTQDSIEVGLGPFSAQLAPGQEYFISRPFESYLAPGVHVVNVKPCCGGEIVYGINLGR
jgi:hypothetical protein